MALGIWSVLKKNGHIRTIDFTKIWGNVNTKSGDAYKQLKNSSIILFSHQIQRVNSLMVKLSFSRLWKYNSQLRTKKMKSLVSLFKFYAQRPLKIQYYYLTEIYLFKNGTEYYKQIHMYIIHMYHIDVNVISHLCASQTIKSTIQQL